jgi:uncharacterized protein YecT (DUF1311 family)
MITKLFYTTVFGGALLLFAGPLLSQSAKHNTIDETSDRCQSKAANTHEEIHCMDVAFTAWDNELNRVYKLLAGRLNGSERETLKASQLAWIRQRDLEFSLINAIYAKLEGTMYLSAQTASKVRIVKERTLLLQHYLELIDEGAEPR